MSRLSPRAGISKITRSQITWTVSIPTSVCLIGSLPGAQDETIAVVAPYATRQNNVATTMLKRTILRISALPLWTREFGTLSIPGIIAADDVVCTPATTGTKLSKGVWGGDL